MPVGSGASFYLNPADPFLVEKRFGIGCTLNFSNRWSWAALAALILVPLALSGLLLR